VVDFNVLQENAVFTKQATLEKRLLRKIETRADVLVRNSILGAVQTAAKLSESNDDHVFDPIVASVLVDNSRATTPPEVPSKLSKCLVDSKECDLNNTSPATALLNIWPPPSALLPPSVSLTGKPLPNELPPIAAIQKRARAFNFQFHQEDPLSSSFLSDQSSARASMPLSKSSEGSSRRRMDFSPPHYLHRRPKSMQLMLPDSFVDPSARAVSANSENSRSTTPSHALVRPLQVQGDISGDGSIGQLYRECKEKYLLRQKPAYRLTVEQHLRTRLHASSPYNK